MAREIDVSEDLRQFASTPANPAANYLRFYAKNDAKLYTLTPAGVETQVGSGATGGGGKTFAFFVS